MRKRLWTGSRKASRKRLSNWYGWGDTVAPSLSAVRAMRRHMERMPLSRMPPDMAARFLGEYKPDDSQAYKNVAFPHYIRSTSRLAAHDGADWGHVSPSLAKVAGRVVRALDRRLIPLHVSETLGPDGPFSRGAAVRLVHSVLGATLTDFESLFIERIMARPMKREKAVFRLFRDGSTFVVWRADWESCPCPWASYQREARRPVQLARAI